MIKPQSAALVRNRYFDNPQSPIGLARTRVTSRATLRRVKPCFAQSRLARSTPMRGLWTLRRCAATLLGSGVIARRTAQASLGSKDEWMKQVRSIDRANKAMIAQAVAAIEGLAFPIFRGPENFWYWTPSQQAIHPEALVDCYRRQAIMIRRGTCHTQRFGHRLYAAATDGRAGAHVQRPIAAILKEAFR
jgi:hypothetical protein